MKRIILHWTGGAHTPSNLDKQHYHFIVDGAGKVHPGKFPVSANAAPVKGAYAAHTLNCNTGSIGVAVAAMAGAQERPFNPGSHPITPAQISAFVALCARLAKEYGIPVTRQTILTHAEVQPTLGIKQRGKWDICWLPGFPGPQDAVQTGDWLRAHITAAMAPAKPASAPPVHDAAPAAPTPAAKPQGFWAWLLSLFAKGN
jgi:N-acetyl-anhydromuramyl-L-alanine amidase AmpD